MITIAVTGGIASGKSLVLQVAEKYNNVRIVDADEVAWKTYLPGREAHGKILKTFGREVLSADGTVDRASLGSLVFNDPKALRKLESIVHPIVMKRLTEIKAEAKKEKLDLIVEVSALLDSEYANNSFFDYIVFVDAPREERKKRLINRDGISPPEAARRIASQELPDTLADPVDYVIDSSQSEMKTKAEARRVFDELLT